jgi:Ca2+-binding RTX toxin-like protein
MGTELDGADVYNGGPDDDLASYAERSKPLSIKLCIAADITGCAADTCDCQPISGEDGETDTLVNIESVEGGSGDDTIVGDDDMNVISGGSGNDTIQGLGGDDQIDGDIGDDTIDGGAGDDLITARQGHDKIDCGDGKGDICLYGKDASVNKTTCEVAEQVEN